MQEVMIGTCELTRNEFYLIQELVLESILAYSRFAEGILLYILLCILYYFIYSLLFSTYFIFVYIQKQTGENMWLLKKNWSKENKCAKRIGMDYGAGSG